MSRATAGVPALRLVEDIPVNEKACDPQALRTEHCVTDPARCPRPWTDGRGLAMGALHRRPRSRGPPHTVSPCSLHELVNASGLADALIGGDPELHHYGRRRDDRIKFTTRARRIESSQRRDSNVRHAGQFEPCHDARSSGIPMSPATRSRSASCARSVALARQATVAIMQSSIPRGVMPAARQRR